MSSAWPKISFDQAPLQIIDGDRGKNYPKRDEFDKTGHCLFLNTGNVTKSGFNFGDCQFITEQKDNLLRAGKLAREDVIMTTRGTIGNVGYFNRHVPFENIRINSGMVIFRSDSEKLRPSFLYQYLRSEQFNKQVNSLRSGAAQPQLPIRDIKVIELPLPPLAIQEAISETIVKYDDLIENNKCRIELLEESARQLYKEWFVRFRFPGHEHVKIIDGVPEGWESKKVGELLMKVKRPGKVKKDDYLEFGDFPCIDQSRGFISGYTDDSEVIIKEPLPLVVFGDHTRVLKFVDFSFTCGADGTQLLHPSDSQISIEYFYFALVAIDLSNYFYARHFKFLKDQIVLIPSEQLMQAFTNFASTNMKQISKLRDQNKELASARDLLLPKLMNGEIVV